MMSTSLSMQQRKEAVQRYCYRHWSTATICRHLHCSRSWLDRWLSRYNPDTAEASVPDRASTPHQAHSPWSADIRQQVLEMRRTRMQQAPWPYAVYGAATIHWTSKGQCLSEPQTTSLMCLYFATVGAIDVHFTRWTRRQMFLNRRQFALVPTYPVVLHEESVAVR